MNATDATREQALRCLPATYAVALRLRAAGATDELIVQCLDIEPEALRPLLQIAEAKLAAVIGAESQARAGRWS